MTEIFILAAIIGVIPAIIAERKGYSFILWWFFGCAVFIIALPFALLLEPKQSAIEQKQLSQGMQKCPSCAEMIKSEAQICRYCSLKLRESTQKPKQEARQYVTYTYSQMQKHPTNTLKIANVIKCPAYGIQVEEDGFCPKCAKHHLIADSK